MEIKVKRKTLFFFPNFKNDLLNIYDNKGVLFYSSDFVSNFLGYFYLPSGTYTANHYFKQVNGKLQQPKIKLPKRERDFKHNFKEFKILFGINKHKCTIDHDEKTILFDNSFLDAPKYVLAFILYHEQGHNFYETEWKADLFSVAKMLKEGYNISQIIKAPFTLSEKQENRKLKILQHFENLNNG